MTDLVETSLPEHAVRMDLLPDIERFGQLLFAEVRRDEHVRECQDRPKARKRKRPSDSDRPESCLMERFVDTFGSCDA